MSSDVVVAIVWVALFVSAGLVVAVGLVVRARTVVARANADLQQRYQELAERSVDSATRVEARLEELTRRVAAIEKLLKDVG